MRRILLLALLAALAATLIRTPTARAAEGEFRFIVFEELITLDPQRMTWLADIRVAQCLFEPLVLVKLPEQTLEPGVAERWEVSPDQRTFTFHLRRDARWSNGDPVTAQDFVHAWRRAMLPDTAADYSQLFWRIDGAEAFFKWRSGQLQVLATKSWPDQATARRAVEEAWKLCEEQFGKTVGLTAPDDHTLVVRLAQPTPYFLELVTFATFMPVHRASVARATSLNPDTGMLAQDPNWTKPENLVCNGPYKLARWRFKRDLLMEVNEHYWNRARVGSAAILQKHIPDVQAAILAYQRGEADWIPDLPTAKSVVADLVQTQRPDLHVFTIAGTYFYNFNCNPTLNDGKPNPLADARIRRALALAIDRPTIVQRVTRLKQPPARTFVPPQAIPGYDPPLDAGAGEFDPAAARRMLTEAGHTDGQAIAGLSILYNTEGGHETIAQQIKSSWEKNLGVVVNLEGVEKRTFGARLRRHDFTIARASWIGDYRDPTTFLDKFLSDNGNNDAAYRSARFDQSMAQAAATTDRAARMGLLRQAEALMLADQPIAPIYHYVFVDLYDPLKVTGLYENPWNYRRLELVRVRR